MAILRQQTNFVEQLYSSGMLDEQEKELLLEPVEKKERKLHRKGAVWRAPKIVDVRALANPIPYGYNTAADIASRDILPTLIHIVSDAGTCLQSNLMPCSVAVVHVLFAFV